MYHVWRYLCRVRAWGRCGRCCLCWCCRRSVLRLCVHCTVRGCRSQVGVLDFLVGYGAPALWVSGREHLPVAERLVHVALFLVHQRTDRADALVKGCQPYFHAVPDVSLRLCVLGCPIRARIVAVCQFCPGDALRPVAVLSARVTRRRFCRFLLCSFRLAVRVFFEVCRLDRFPVPCVRQCLGLRQPDAWAHNPRRFVWGDGCVPAAVLDHGVQRVLLFLREVRHQLCAMLLYPVCRRAYSWLVQKVRVLVLCFLRRQRGCLFPFRLQRILHQLTVFLLPGGELLLGQPPCQVCFPQFLVGHAVSLGVEVAHKDFHRLWFFLLQEAVQFVQRSLFAAF